MTADVTPSTFRRIVRHLEQQQILYRDDAPRVVENVVRSFLYGRTLRRVGRPTTYRMQPITGPILQEDVEDIYGGVTPEGRTVVR